MKFGHDFLDIQYIVFTCTLASRFKVTKVPVTCKYEIINILFLYYKYKHIKMEIFLLIKTLFQCIEDSKKISYK